MNVKTAIRRAKRGFREDLRLYLVAVSSLAVAFLCLASALMAIDNLSALADHWGSSRRITVYLRDGARTKDVEQLRLLLEGLPAVTGANYVSQSEAREAFLASSDIEGDLGGLTADAFPATLEVALAANVPVQRLTDIAAKIARFGAVEDVETYRGWFAKLESLLVAGRGIAGAIALLVVICVIAVVGNTIRLAIASRRSEIEVMKLCGATDNFVRWPFVIEGAIQGFASAALSVVMLVSGYLLFADQVNGSIVAFTGMKTVFLHPATILSLVLGGAALGAAGSVVSVRRYLVV